MNKSGTILFDLSDSTVGPASYDLSGHLATGKDAMAQSIGPKTGLPKFMTVTPAPLRYDTNNAMV